MHESKFQDIDYSVNEHTARITMNRPRVLNALSQRMFSDLSEAIRQAKQDNRVSFLTLTGAGGAFSSGLDIVQVASLKKMDARKFVYQLVRPFWQEFFACDKPIISLVNGSSYGAGAEIALLSDIVIASEKAVFAFSGGRVGALCCVSAILGPLLMNGRTVVEMNLTGQPVTAREALNKGMINYVVPEDMLETKFDDVKREIMRVSPDSNASFKRIQKSVIPNKALTVAYRELFKTLTTSNFRKGVEAFTTKKPASYYSD